MGEWADLVNHGRLLETVVLVFDSGNELVTCGLTSGKVPDLGE